MSMVLLILGILALYVWNRNRRLGVLAAPFFQIHGFKILCLGLGLCALAGIV